MLFGYIMSLIPKQGECLFNDGPLFRFCDKQFFSWKGSLRTFHPVHRCLLDAFPAVLCLFVSLISAASPAQVIALKSARVPNPVTPIASQLTSRQNLENSISPKKSTKSSSYKWDGIPKTQGGLTVQQGKLSGGLIQGKEALADKKIIPKITFENA